MSPYVDHNGNLVVERIRKDFPILNQRINDKPLVYFDNAASTQKPKVVIDSISNYYQTMNANIHRGIHTLAERATVAYEDTRISLQKFINASSSEQIIFTRGATEAINLIASTYGVQNIAQGDCILVSAMEHHSNIVPWQILAARVGAQVKIIPINDSGELILEAYQALLNEKVKLVAVNHVSNTLGTINPIETITELAHKVGAVVVIDGAQSVSHLDIDVQALDIDFFVLSSHKFYGPTGIGALYGKKHLLEQMPPYHGGGEMIKEVTYEGFSINELPYKFEAGTPNIADTVALKSAIDYINFLSKDKIRTHENHLLNYATSLLTAIDGLKIIGTAKEKVSVISFVIEGVHHQDIGILLDQKGIALRTGHHCTQPLMGRFGISGTSRASFAVYNTIEEIDIMVDALKNAIKMLR
ncbi:MAG: cysteine desulfurase [Cytophagales bacterium]|nr:MAG: cysteine desulfurase [Cytophagales bacterium]